MFNSGRWNALPFSFGSFLSQVIQEQRALLKVAGTNKLVRAKQEKTLKEAEESRGRARAVLDAPPAVSGV